MQISKGRFSALVNNSLRVQHNSSDHTTPEFITVLFNFTQKFSYLFSDKCVRTEREMHNLFCSLSRSITKNKGQFKFNLQLKGTSAVQLRDIPNQNKNKRLSVTLKSAQLHLTIRGYLASMLQNCCSNRLSGSFDPFFFKNGYTHLNTHQLTASQCKSHDSFSRELSPWTTPRKVAMLETKLSQNALEYFCTAFRRKSVKAERGQKALL